MRVLVSLTALAAALASLAAQAEARACFPGDMQVLMADGTLRKIEDIRMGELVQSYDETSGRPVLAAVEELHVSEADRLIRIDLDSGTSVWSTPDHPYFSHTDKTVVSFAPYETRKKYELDARQMRQADEVLQNSLGNPVAASVAQVSDLDTSVSVYTLALSPTHWFYVQGVLVHNKRTSSSSSGSSSTSSTSSSSSWFGSSSSSSTSYYSSSGGWYTLTSSGYYTSSTGHSWTTINTYRNQYYYRSNTCRTNPSEPGCESGATENIVCGCPEGSLVGNADLLEDASPVAEGDSAYAEGWTTEDATSNAFGFAPCAEGSASGICVDTNYDRYCMPEYLEFTERLTEDPAWKNLEYMIESHCYEEYSSCNDDYVCYADYLENTAHLRTGYRSPADGAPEVYTRFQECMNTSTIFCRCEWEICDEGVSDVSEIALYIGIGIAGLILGCLTCMCICKVRAENAAKVRIVPVSGVGSTSTKAALCFANIGHVYESASTDTMAQRGQKAYLEGYICDKCNQGYPPNSDLNHCNICNLDFCQRCVDYRKTDPN